MKICWILKGVQGSGKSTIAKKLAAKHNATIVSADNFHINDDGVYDWKIENQGKAHKDCQDKFDFAIYCHKNVIVDNTNLNSRDLNYYKDTALQAGHLVVVVEPSIHRQLEDRWCYAMEDMSYPSQKDKDEIAKILTERNVHKVPYETIKAKVDQWKPFEGAKFFEEKPDATYYYLFPVELP